MKRLQACLIGGSGRGLIGAGGDCRFTDLILVPWRIRSRLTWRGSAWWRIGSGRHLHIDFTGGSIRLVIEPLAEPVVNRQVTHERRSTAGEVAAQVLLRLVRYPG
jgi:hypothetical protein